MRTDESIKLIVLNDTSKNDLAYSDDMTRKQHELLLCSYNKTNSFFISLRNALQFYLYTAR